MGEIDPRLVLHDRLLELGAVVPAPDACESDWRFAIVPALFGHQGDSALEAVTKSISVDVWTAAALATSLRHAKFNGAVVAVLATGEHPSGGRIQERLRGERTASEGLNGVEAKWRALLLKALGWKAPPPGDYGKWVPPGKVAKRSHKWGSEVEGVWTCRRCGRLKWVGTVVGLQPRYRYADTEEEREEHTFRGCGDGGQRKAGNCVPREGA